MSEIAKQLTSDEATAVQTLAAQPVSESLLMDRRSPTVLSKIWLGVAAASSPPDKP
jgi:hypothetical protein